MRAIQDALTGIFYADDSQVTSGYRRKAYADAPGIEVEIINVDKYREIEEAEKNDGRKESK
jgi:Holliday junction resolvase RusA-like endonuclease